MGAARTPGGLQNYMDPADADGSELEEDSDDTDSDSEEESEDEEEEIPEEPMEDAKAPKKAKKRHARQYLCFKTPWSIQGWPPFSGRGPRNP